AVRPVLEALLEPARVRPQRVDAEALLLARRPRVGLALRRADAAGAEDQAGAVLALTGVDRAARTRVLGERPHLDPVEGDRVLDDGPGVEPGQADHGVVVPAHLER